jgi:fatty-acyl-CoA synthase
MMLNTQMTMEQAWEHCARDHLKQEALIGDGFRLTYGELARKIDSLASALHGLGLSKGDKVVCLLPPGPEFAILFFALAKIGAVIVPLSPQVSERTLINVCQDAQPESLVCPRRREGSLLSQLGPLRQVVTLDSSPGAHISFDDLLASGGSTTPLSGDISTGDLLALLYTSGTTGRPKGTMHTHKSLIAPVVASLKVRELWMTPTSLSWLGRSLKALSRYRTRLLRAVGRPQTFLSTAGWHTVTGLEVMLQALLMGDRMVVMSRFHPRKALEWIQREGVTVMVAVPMAIQVMLDLARVEHFDVSSLLICGTGAAPCPPDLAHRVQQEFGCAVHIGFGATETGGGISVTSLEDSDERQAGTVGRPMPGMEVKIVDEDRRQAPPGQVGELAVRSDSIMQGYYQAPEATAEILDEQGWYYTGDLAYMDKEDYLHIVGRKKELIIRGGQNIYPAELESYLVAHPKIKEAAVVGVPSKVGGEAVWAYLILDDDQNLTAREALDYCRQGLEPYMVPSQVRFVEDFPRSENGKPQKFKLREMSLQPTEKGAANHER